MTREQAIKHGQEQLEIFGGEHGEFIKLAIKALSKGTCKECKHWQKAHKCWGDMMYCELLSDEYMFQTEEDYFCADYENREGKE